MDVRPGYKRTSVGVIPEDWSERRLGEIGQALIGLTYSPSDVSSDGVLVLRSSNVAGGSLRFEDNVFVDMPVPDRAIVRDGDILICVRNGSRDLIGKCAKIDRRVEGMAFGAFMAVFRTPHHDFVFHQFQSDALKRQIHAHLGATINQITNASLNAFRIPLPNNEAEQRAIAAALSDVDALLAKLDELIAKKRDLKQAAMQQLLSGQTRLPGFHGEWEVKRLGELADMASGGTPLSSVPAYYGGDIPWVSIADMTKAGKVIEMTEKTLTPLGLANSAAQMLAAGTVLYAMYASLGECSIAGSAVCTSQAILGIRPKTQLDNEFLYYFLRSIKTAVKNIGQQGTQSNLNKGMVQDFRLGLPSREEQAAIAAVLSDMDAELSALEARRDKTHALKQAMMQELLTGRTRLVRPEQEGAAAC